MILIPSEIILISLCFIKITNKLVLVGLLSYSSSNQIFMELYGLLEILGQLFE